MASNFYDETVEALEQEETPQPRSAQPRPIGAVVRDILREEQQRQDGALRSAIRQSPTSARAAEARRLALQLGVPSAVIERNLEHYQREGQLETLSRAGRESPALRAWVGADPANAALAKDDVEPLSKLDRALGIGRSLIGAPVAGLAGFTEAAWQQIRLGAEATGAEQIGAFAQESALVADYLRQLARGPRVADAGFVETAVYGGLESVGQMAPGLVLGLLTRNPNVFLATAGLTTAGAGYGQARAQGVGVGKSAAFGAAQGIVEVVTEFIPAHRLFKDLLVKQLPLLTTIARQMVPEVATEEVATFFQDLNEWMLLPANKDRTIGDFARERPSAAAATAISTLVAVGAQTSIAAGTVRLLERLGEAVGESKTAKATPEALREFVAQAVKDGAPDAFYAPIESWVTYWQSQGVDPSAKAEEITGSRDAYATAVQEGSSIRIPTEVYAAKLAPTEAHSFFVNELRLQPDEMNGRELEAFNAELRALPVPSEEAQGAPKPMSQVYASVFDQLVKRGRIAPFVAQRYATVFEAGVKTLADIEGVEPVAMLEPYKLQAVREETPEEVTSVQMPSERKPEPSALPLEAAAATTPEAGTVQDTSEKKDTGAALPKPKPYDVLRDALPSLGFIASLDTDPVWNRLFDRTYRKLGRTPTRGEMRVAVEEMIAQLRQSRDEELARRQSEQGIDVAPPAAQTEGTPDATETVPQPPEAARGVEPTDRGAERPVPDEERPLEGRGDREGAERGGLPAEPRTFAPPELDEVFERRPLAENAARLTPEVRRELAHIQDELETFPFVPRTWNWLEEGQKTGNAAGGAAEIVAGTSGAKVYDDILYLSPVNLHKGKPARQARGTRQKVLEAVRSVLADGDIASNLAEGAVRVAERRAAEVWTELSPPDLPRDWGADARPAFIEDVFAAVEDATEGDVPVDLLVDPGAESEVTEPLEGDTSFNVDEFDQSLFDKDDQSTETAVDRLETGETQPRLPGEVGAVREEEKPTPTFEAPFSLTGDITKPRNQKQRTLWQAAFHGSAARFEQFSLQKIGTGQGAQSYGWGLYFATVKDVADRYRQELAGKPRPKELVYDDVPLFDREIGLYYAALDSEGFPSTRAQDRELARGLLELNSRAYFEKPGRAWIEKQRDVLTRSIENTSQAIREGRPFSGDLDQDRYRLEDYEAALKALDVFGDKLEIRPPETPGRTYTVEIPEDEDYLAWDRPVSAQSQKVKQALERLGMITGLTTTSAGAIYEPLGMNLYEELARRLARPASAPSTYWSEKRDYEAASKALAAEGLAGIRYLDAGSRAQGEGTSNYVVFDDRLVQIVEYDQPARPLDNETVMAWAAEVKARVGPDLQEFDVYLTKQGDLRLDTIVVARAAQRQGLGSKVVLELTRFADLNGLRITLSPADRNLAFGTTSRGRLVRFYKRFGFVENKGRYADLSLSAGMYREPTAPTSVTEFQQPPFYSALLRAGQTGPVTQAAAMRGAIRFGPERQVTIALMEKADLSTFLHESGHFFLELFGDMVDRLSAKDPVTLTDRQRKAVADYRGLLAHLGVKARAELTDAHHEEFARTFEAYLREGKAPSVELRGVFATFRAWLLDLYRSLKLLNVRLTPEVSGILDRMFASEQAIAEMERRHRRPPMFSTPAEMGVTPEEFAAYRRTVEAASQRAREELDARLMAEVQQEQTEAFRARRAEVEAEVSEAVYQEPVYRALAAIRRGTQPNGDPLVEGLETEPMKLSKAIIVERYGASRLASLPKPAVYVVDGGLDPEVVAERFEFSSGDELLTKLAQAPPMRQVITNEVARRMLEEQGSLLLEGRLTEAAQAAVLNEERDEVIKAELRAFAKLQRTVAPHLRAERAKAKRAPGQIRAALPPIAELRAVARERIARLRIREIKPALFWNAARAASTRAFEAAARQDYDGAIVAKQQELYNQHLYREAERVLEDIAGRVRQARDLAKPAAQGRLGLAGPSYRDQVNGVLDRFGFERMSQRALDRLGKLKDWIAERKSEGLPVEGIPEDVLAETQRKPYQEMTVEEFLGMSDGLRQLVHLARVKTRLLREADQREFSEARDAFVESIRSHKPKRKKKLEIRPSDQAGRFIESFLASHRRLADLVAALDGDVDGGPGWELLVRPANEAGDAEAARKGQIATTLLDVFERHYPGRRLRELNEKVYIPAIDHSLSLEGRLAVALNWGNKEGRARVLSDRWLGWNETQALAVLDTLTENDWRFVQAFIDQLGVFWPEISAKMERVTGVQPVKVEAVPIVTKFGTFPGGYYPLGYDRRKSPDAAAFEDASLARFAVGTAYLHTTTKRGHEQTRVEHSTLPLRLDLSVAFKHVDQVIHDLTHHEMLIDVTRMLRDEKVKAAITETHGDVVFDKIKSAVDAIAVGKTPSARTPEETIATYFRTGAQVAGLGWNFLTGVAQTLGIYNGAAEIGPIYILRGLRRMLGDAAHLENTAAWLRAKSPFLASRASTATQDLYDIRETLLTAGGRFDAFLRTVTLDRLTQKALTESFLWHIGFFQQFADHVTWIGAYEQALEARKTDADAVALADQAVINAQGSGSIKDLAAVQRGGPLARLFMTFASYGITVFNQNARAIRRTDFRSPASALTLLGNLSLINLMPAVSIVLLRAALGREDDEKTWADWFGLFARETVAGALNMMIFLREFGVLAREDVRGYEGPAGGRAIQASVRLWQQAAQGDLDTGLWKAANQVGGVLLHYPSAQVQRSVDGWMALMEERRTRNPFVVLGGPPPQRRAN